MIKRTLIFLLVICLALFAACGSTQTNSNLQSIEGTWNLVDSQEWLICFYANGNFESFSGEDILYSGTYDFNPESALGSLTITNTPDSMIKKLSINNTGTLHIEGLGDYKK